jgi:hypothetical protein
MTPKPWKKKERPAPPIAVGGGVYWNAVDQEWAVRDVASVNMLREERLRAAERKAE